MASMQDVQPRLGYTDLLAMPDDGRRYEIHGGELVVVPSPRLGHQIAAARLVALLEDYRRRAGGLVVAAPFDVVFDEYDVAQPDVVFFRAERVHLLDPYAVAYAAPDIVVEVLSPSTADVDRGRKMRMFARHGVPEYWIVDPIGRQVEVHVLEGRAYRQAQAATGVDILRSVLLPDLTFGVAGLFTFP